MLPQEMLTATKYEEYYQSFYRHADEIPDMSQLKREWVTAGRPGANARGRPACGNATTNTASTYMQRIPAGEFTRSFKRSKDDYTKLRDPKHWIDWNRQGPWNG